MKIDDLFEAESPNPIIQALKDKKLDFDEMLEFLEKQSYLTQPYPNKKIFRIKKKAGTVLVSSKTLVNALNKIVTDGTQVNSWHSNEIDVDWNYDKFLDGKILFDQSDDKDQIHRQISYARAHGRGTGGGKAWFVRSFGYWPAVGEFMNGPMKGEPFATGYFSKVKLKRGDHIKIEVLISNGTITGDVRIMG